VTDLPPPVIETTAPTIEPAIVDAVSAGG
jgi:hypothetical protein